MEKYEYERINNLLRTLMNKNYTTYSEVSKNSERMSDGSCTLAIDTVLKCFIFKVNGISHPINIFPVERSIKNLKFINDIDINEILTTKNVSTNDTITTILNNYALKIHTHDISDITNLQNILDIKALKTDLDNYALKIHIHDISDINELQNILDMKALKTDLDNYYEKNYIDNTFVLISTFNDFNKKISADINILVSDVSNINDLLKYIKINNENINDEFYDITIPIKVNKINDINTIDILTPNKIINNIELQNLLRGPQGIQGIQGPKGEKGEKGEKGDSKAWYDWLLQAFNATGVVANAIASSYIFQNIQTQITVIQGQIVAMDTTIASIQAELTANNLVNLTESFQTNFTNIENAWNNLNTTWRGRLRNSLQNIKRSSGDFFRRIVGREVQDTQYLLGDILVRDANINLLSIQNRDVKINDKNTFTFEDIPDDSEEMDEMMIRLAILTETCRFIASTEKPDDITKDVAETAIVGKTYLDELILKNENILDIIDNKINEIPKTDLSDYYTKNETINEITTKINEIPKVDLSDYYVKNDIDNKLNVITYYSGNGLAPKQDVSFRNGNLWNPKVNISSTITTAQIGIRVYGYLYITNPQNQNISITAYWSPDGIYENRLAESTSIKRGDGKWQSHYTFASESPNFCVYPTEKLVGLRIYPYFKINYLTKYDKQDNIQNSYYNLSKRFLTTETNTKNITSSNTTTALLGDLNVNLGKIIVKDIITNTTQNSNYITEKDVDTKINNIPKPPATDLSNYYTKTDIDNKYIPDIKNVNFNYSFIDGQYKFTFDNIPQNGEFNVEIYYDTYDYVKYKIVYNNWVPTLTYLDKGISDSTAFYRITIKDNYIEGEGPFGNDSWTNASKIKYTIKNNNLQSNVKTMLLSDTKNINEKLEKIKNALLNIGVSVYDLW